MKKIINDLLYDTDKAKKIFSYRQQRKVSTYHSLSICEWFRIDVYKTSNDNFFIHGYIKDKRSIRDQFIEEISKKELEEVIKQVNPDKYIRMCEEYGFRKIKEA